MQERKRRAFIKAECDTETGACMITANGESDVLCRMIGTLIRNMATSKSKVAGIPIEQAFDETFDTILKAVCYTSSSEVKIDFSRKVKEG